MTDVFIFVISHCVAILWEEIIWCSNTLGRNRAPAAHLYLNSTLLDPTSNRYLNCQFVLDSFIILATLSSDASSVEVVSHKGWAPAKCNRNTSFGGAFNPKVFFQIGFLAWWFLEKIQRKRGSGSIQNIKWCRFQGGMDYANWAQVGKTNKPAKLKKQQSQGASVCSFSGEEFVRLREDGK